MGFGFLGGREGALDAVCQTASGLLQFWCFPGERIHSDIYVQVTARIRGRDFLMTTSCR